MSSSEAAPASVACISYLARVHTLHVARFPRLNYGVDVDYTTDVLAGDGPLVAAGLRALGHPATLHSNPVADDAPGRAITACLAAWEVPLRTSAHTAQQTRTNIVVVDKQGHRTWFSGLAGVADELRALDPAEITTAPTVYLDCYEVLLDSPSRILDAALEAGRGVVINLGGSPPPGWLASTLRGRRVRVLQTNSDETGASAKASLEALSDLKVADLTVVTAGRLGAVGRTHDGRDVTATAPPVQLKQAQGAGAAFSAALIHGLRRGDDLDTTLRFACAAGSLWCSRPFGDALAEEDEIYAFQRRPLDLTRRDPVQRRRQLADEPAHTGIELVRPPACLTVQREPLHRRELRRIRSDLRLAVGLEHKPQRDVGVAVRPPRLRDRQEERCATRRRVEVRDDPQFFIELPDHAPARILAGVHVTAGGSARVREILSPAHSEPARDPGYWLGFRGGSMPPLGH